MTGLQKSTFKFIDLPRYCSQNEFLILIILLSFSGIIWSLRPINLKIKQRDLWVVRYLSKRSH